MQAVTREGKRLRTASLDVRVVITSRDHSRIGFVVPKHGRTAVQRNRLKRALRELTRLSLLSALRGSKAGSSMDIVMRALPIAYHARFGALRGEIESLATRLDRARQQPGAADTAPLENQ